VVQDERDGQFGFDELLERVLRVAGEVQVGVSFQTLAQIARQLAGAFQFAFSFGFVFAVDGADSQRGMPGQLARLRQCGVAPGGFPVEFHSNLVGNAVQIAHLSCLPEEGSWPG